VYEVPISYHGRTYEEGKKIGWKDGVKALGVILHFWLVDDLYEASYGRGLLHSLTGTPQYLSWLTRVLRPHLGGSVLEIGAGLGNLTARLMARKLQYVAVESEPLYLHALRNRFLRTPNVTVSALDVNNPADYAPLTGQFDTAVCINVLEMVQDPAAVLASIRSCLAPDGAILVLVPQGKSLYGSLDRALGHLRRYSSGDLDQLFRQTGFRMETILQLNKVGAAAWWVFGRLLTQKRIDKPALKIFDKTVWLWRRIDGLLPWAGLSLIAIAKRV
jgi:SAM-dependent methyltransferase